MRPLIASLKIFLLRVIFVLPLHSSFVNLSFPLAVTGFGTLACYYFTRDLLSTVGTAIAWMLIALFYQKLLERVFFTHGLNSFLLGIRHSHPVTQKFAANLLVRFFDDTHYATLSNALFKPTGPANLKSLIQMIENSGVPLDTEMYAVLLTRAGELYPSEMIATWDTDAIPIEVDRYQGYFAILRRVYSHMNPKKKRRIFIFANPADFHKKAADPTWKSMLDCHRDYFGFRRVHYCYKQQFDGFRDGSPDADKNLGDFVFYKTGFLFMKYRWVIGREGGSNNSYMISDDRVVRATERFVLELVAELDRKKQFVDL